MSYEIRYADSVVKHDIPALPKSARELIKKAITERLTADPIRFGKPLRRSLSGSRRLRVANYRVIYIIDHKAFQVLITAIGHRKDIYDE